MYFTVFGYQEVCMKQLQNVTLIRKMSKTNPHSTKTNCQ